MNDKMYKYLFWFMVGCSNYDRLRAMSVEEMAEFMAQTGAEYSCPPPHYFAEKGFCRNELVDMSCKLCWLDWLKKEAEE